MSRPVDRPAITSTPIGRRRLLRNGGVVLSLGAIAAACGEDRAGPQEPGRVGNAPAPEPLPDGEVNDVVLLRTAQSLEFTAIEVYDVAVGLDVLDAATLDVVARFVDDHTGHADRLGELITGAGGEEFRCPNPWYMERAVGPILEAVEGSDDLVRDVLQIAHVFEAVAAATYQELVRNLTEPDLRYESMLIGADENRHAATLAMALTGTPEGYVNPVLLGEEPAADPTDVPLQYAIPSQFGQLGTRELVVGPRDEGGGRFSIIVQTPAENSFVYDFMSC
ncbi:MAG: ferritin-like domain-containing protein [Ilumatobacter sp.]|nr:MAG: ferritin-like domain-containing protein [Ilumatobacter sp.]